MNIKNYAVVAESGTDRAETTDKLVAKVTEAIKLGFQPVGGVSVAFEPVDIPAATVSAERKGALRKPRLVMTQAMVKVVTAADVYGQVVARANGS